MTLSFTLSSTLESFLGDSTPMILKAFLSPGVTDDQ